MRGDSGGGAVTSGADGGGSGGGDSGGDSGVGVCGGGEGGIRRLTPVLELSRGSSDAFKPSPWPIMVPSLPLLWPLLHAQSPAVVAAAYRLVSLGESLKRVHFPPLISLNLRLRAK